MACFDSILDYKQREDEDYYKILGCDENSTTEQICAEYKVRALSLHPDKNPTVPDADKQFQRLQLAKEVLTDPERRRKYDIWLRSGLCVPFDHWLAKKDNVQMSMHWAVRAKKDLMLPCGEDCVERSQPIPATVGTSRGLQSNYGAGRLGDVQWFQSGARSWERDSTAKDVLKKFRNYEI